MQSKLSTNCPFNFMLLPLSLPPPPPPLLLLLLPPPLLPLPLLQKIQQAQPQPQLYQCQRQQAAARH